MDVEQQLGGAWRVIGEQGWGVGVDFPREVDAQIVARVIELARADGQTDAEYAALSGVARALGIDLTPKERSLTATETMKLTEMAMQATRQHGIDGDDINSDTIGDAVHPGVFSEALELFDAVPAAELSDVIHEAISLTYWRMVDEANGIEP